MRLFAYICGNKTTHKYIKPIKTMLLSMTGFGRATAELPEKKITVEIKSLNSKQFDFSARVPSVYRSMEVELRNRLAPLLERGKVDMSVSVDSTGSQTTVRLNNVAIAEYRRQIQEAAATAGLPEPADWWSVLMRFPDVSVQETASELDDSERQAVADAVMRAADALMQHRRAEGVKLEEFFRKRIDAISGFLAEVPRYESGRIDRIKARFSEALSKIPVIDYDKGRLEQEMIFYIEKLDVNEEKQRLEQHLRYFVETMELPHPGQGKKLGFIAQEMGREINTLGSKSNDADMQRLVVMMKDNLEQIKEQVLNVM